MGSDDTIYALASAQGRAGIAVVRVSGPKAAQSLARLSSDHFPQRQAVLSKIYDPQTGALIDEPIIIYFQPPRSYTGEDVVEYHIHGGKAVRDSLLNALSHMDGHRMAEAGEFTRRAFENGRMDLTQAEAVADLIHAETEAQKQLALSQMGGALAELYQGWASQLVKALAYAEAQIDFSEEDLPEDEIKSQVEPVLMQIFQDIAVHLDDGNRGEILRDGIKIAVIGAPNAGKSSLVNALAKRDVAIVSDVAGTTRDVLEVHLDLNGYPVTLYDTAGLRPEQLGDESAQDKIESEGIKRALKIAAEADFKILLFDGTEDSLHPQTLALQDEKSIIVINKCDLYCHSERSEESLKYERDSLSQAPQNNKNMYISTFTGEGLSVFIEHVSRETMKLFEDIQHSPSLTRARHREALTEANEHIQRALSSVSPDMIAEDIRLAVRAIGKITGRTDVEDLLDIIFRDFCIGK
jgi:tRNA modification GTPase